MWVRGSFNYREPHLLLITSFFVGAASLISVILQDSTRIRDNHYRALRSLAHTIDTRQNMTGRKVWFITSADAVGLAEQKVADLKEQIDAFRDLSTSLALNDLQSTRNRR